MIKKSGMVTLSYGTSIYPVIKRPSICLYLQPFVEMIFDIPVMEKKKANNKPLSAVPAFSLS